MRRAQCLVRGCVHLREICKCRNLAASGVICQSQVLEPRFHSSRGFSFETPFLTFCIPFHVDVSRASPSPCTITSIFHCASSRSFNITYWDGSCSAPLRILTGTVKGPVLNQLASPLHHLFNLPRAVLLYCIILSGRSQNSETNRKSRLADLSTSNAPSTRPYATQATTTMGEFYRKVLSLHLPAL